MQRIQRKALMGLVVLGLVGAMPAVAQDTTTTERTPQPGADSLTMPGQGGAADTAGYSGMERDTSGARAQGADTAGVETGAVRADTAAADTQRTDAAGQAGAASPGASSDPNGFRWTEPSDFKQAGQTPPVGATDAVQPSQQTGQDRTGAGGADTATQDPVENPPGFRGMERDTTQVPPGAAPTAETPTSRTEQMERQAEASDTENPPGYRGMEKPKGQKSKEHKEHADSTSNE